VTEQQLRAQVDTLLDDPLDELGDDEDLTFAGLDSIRLMSLITAWRADGHDVTFEALVERPTFAAWRELLEVT
jgi:bifunctional isochorismate lyase/aryl carrier protein